MLNIVKYILTNIYLDKILTMKKLLIILAISFFGQIFGQKKAHLYLDSFDKNEIPEISALRSFLTFGAYQKIINLVINLKGLFSCKNLICIHAKLGDFV